MKSNVYVSSGMECCCKMAEIVEKESSVKCYWSYHGRGQTGPKTTAFQLELESNRHYHPAADPGTEQRFNEVCICQCMNGAGLPFEVNLVICADVISPWRARA